MTQMGEFLKEGEVQTKGEGEVQTKREGEVQTKVQVKSHETDKKRIASDNKPQKRLVGLPRADEVCAFFMGYRCRNAIANLIEIRGGRTRIWSLFLQALDAGILSPTTVDICSPHIMRYFFPKASVAWCKQWDVTRQRDIDYIRDVILPAAAIHRQKLLDQPEKADSILKDEIRRLDRERRQVTLPKPQPKIQSSEEEIIMFGKQMWPVEGNVYTYRELRSGVWIFLDINRHLREGENTSLASRAINIRNVMSGWWRFAHHELDEGCQRSVKHVYSVISELSRLMEQNPDGELKYPPTPKTEDYW